jgi:hypothetical protein
MIQCIQYIVVAGNYPPYKAYSLQRISIANVFIVSSSTCTCPDISESQPMVRADETNEIVLKILAAARARWGTFPATGVSSHGTDLVPPNADTTRSVEMGDAGPTNAGLVRLPHRHTPKSIGEGEPNVPGVVAGTEQTANVKKIMKPVIKRRRVLLQDPLPVILKPKKHSASSRDTCGENELGAFPILKHKKHSTSSRDTRGENELGVSALHAFISAAPQNISPNISQLFQEVHSVDIWQQMRSFLKTLLKGRIKLHEVPGDGSCYLHCFSEWGTVYQLRLLLFFCHIMYPDIVSLMGFRRLAGILCQDGRGNARQAVRRSDWCGESSIIVFARVLDNLNTIIVVSPSGRSPHDRGYGVRFNVYVATASRDPYEPRSVIGTHNASIGFVRNSIEKSNGYRVIGFYVNHFCFFTGFDLSQI